MSLVTRLREIWSTAPVASTLLAIALAATLVFGVRTALFFAHRDDRMARDLPVAAWMTPRFISRSWHVPPEVILDAVDAPRPPPNGPMNLATLAEYNGTTTEAVIETVEEAIEQWREAHPERPRDGRGDRRRDGRDAKDESAPQ